MGREKKEIGLLINPRAGNGRALKLLPRAMRYLPTSQHRFHTHICESRQELMDRVQQMVKRKLDIILILGGDGSLHDAVQVATPRGPAFGIIPAGRGNDFVRCLGYPKGLRRICQGFAEPRIVEVDLPEANGIRYLGIASVGFDSVVSRLTRDSKCRMGGTLCYVLSVLRAIPQYKTIPLTLRINGETIDHDRYILTAVGNTSTYGGGMELIPVADPSDGMLDMLYVEKISLAGVLRTLPAVYRGTHLKRREVHVRRIREVTIEGPSRLEVFADGEHLCHLPVTIRVGKHSLRVAVPTV